MTSLNAEYGIPDVLQFEAGEGHLKRAVVSTPACGGAIYLHGAHVTSWQPLGHEPVLWLSEAARYLDGVAIRGGIPICFPWFASHPTDPSAPAHGLARTRAWDVISTEGTDGGARIILAVEIGAWVCTMTVEFGHQLVATLHVRNAGADRATFEAALHTYLAVGDIHAVRVGGLEGTRYIDKVDQGKTKEDGRDPISFRGETDRVYLDTPAAVTLLDPVLGRRIVVGKAGSRSTVVWNPSAEKGSTLSDAAEDDWSRMVCIETANVGPNAIILGPGESWEMSATITVELLAG